MNCKQEFIEDITPLLKESNVNIKCAYVGYERWDGVYADIPLKTRYTPEDYEKFLTSLDFEYDPLDVEKEIVIGTIWFTDGSWAVHGEDFRKVEWRRYCMPDIFKELL